MLQTAGSPLPTHTYPSVEDGSTTYDMSYLPGVAMRELTEEPKIHLIEPSPTNSSFSRSSVAMNPKRSSWPTTKSQLRRSIDLLGEMLQNTQTGLASHGSIMLDFQHRRSHLKYGSNNNVEELPPKATPYAPERHDAPSPRNNNLLSPEASYWWQACQNFAQNSESPISAREFLRTPQPFSGFDFEWGLPNTNRYSLLPQTPTSLEGEQSDFGNPVGRAISLGEETLTSAAQIASLGNGMEQHFQERTIEVDKKKFPAAPKLQPAPGSKPKIIVSKYMHAAVEPELIGSPQRYFNL